MRRFEFEETAVEFNDVTTAEIHVRHDGISNDINLNDLEITGSTPDLEIKMIVANWLDLDEGSFEKYVIERHDNGNMTLRPEAVFGYDKE